MTLVEHAQQETRMCIEEFRRDIDISTKDGSHFVVVPLGTAIMVREAIEQLQASPSPVKVDQADKPRPSDDHLWDETLRDRDQYHEWADKLAEAIAKHFNAYIGEHSNQNCPWSEALDVIENAPASAAAAPDAEFKNFHRSLCARFGYTHDERDWKRDQASLEEYIARQVGAAAAPLLTDERLSMEKILVRAAQHLVDDFHSQDALDFARAIERATLCASPSPLSRDAVPAAPDGYVLMPKRLTAENGAKSAFMGEYSEVISVTCDECDGSGEMFGGFECSECKGEGTIDQKVTIGWDTIKDIYARAVELLAQPTAAPAQQDQAVQDQAGHMPPTRGTDSQQVASGTVLNPVKPWWKRAGMQITDTADPRQVWPHVKAEILELRAEVERRGRAQGGNTIKASAESGQQEARDAARYRWLCDKADVTKLPVLVEWCIAKDGSSYVADGKASIDEAIDAELARALNEVPAPTCKKGESK